MRTRVFFRERLRVNLHQFLLQEFVQRMRASGLTRKELARRIGKRPEVVTRCLGAPSNLTLDTVSDLLLGMGLEPTFSGRQLAQPQAVAVVDEQPAGAMDDEREAARLIKAIMPEEPQAQSEALTGTYGTGTRPSGTMSPQALPSSEVIALARRSPRTRRTPRTEAEAQASITKEWRDYLSNVA
jgi:hypothetical protein